MPEQKKLIQFKNIVKSFEDGQVVLKGVSLDIYENEFVTLLGPSGCGKSTLLKILLGWLPGYQGKVLYDERDVRDYTPEQLQQKMSYIEQNVFLFNTNLQSTQQSSAIQSMRWQMVDDDEIIRLRTNIRKSAEAKVANGTLTVTEMLRELTNESLARQSKALHEIQRLMGIYQLKYTTND